MPPTITALLVLLAIFPGVFGEFIYRTFVGVDWREHFSETVLRLSGFSVIGLVLYLIVSPTLSLGPPVHVVPAELLKINTNPELLRTLAPPYVGHLLGGLAAGALFVLSKRLWSRFSPVSPYNSSWDEFARSNVRNHWVIVSLRNGRAYAGILARSDVSVSRDERDIILEEPAELDEQRGAYVSLPYQSIFLGGETINSIAVYSSPDDVRVTRIWELLLTDKKNDGKETTAENFQEGSRSP